MTVFLSLLVSVTALGATLRLTRLVTTDTITEPVRYRIIDPAQRDALYTGDPLPPPQRPHTARLRLWLYYLATCPCCVSVWCGALVAVPAVLAGTTVWFLIPAGALSLSLITCWLAKITSLFDHEEEATP